MLGDKQETKFEGVMSAQKHSLQTRDLARFGIDFIYICPCFDYFSNILFYWIFVEEILEKAGDGALQEAWRRVVQNDVAMLRESFNKPYLLERL